MSSKSRRLAALALAAGACLAAVGVVAAIRWPGIRLSWAERAIDAGRLGEANAILVPLAAGDDPRAVTLLARLRLRQKRPDFVVDLLETRLRSRQVDEWLPLLAEAYLALGRDRDAWGTFRAAVDRRPEDLSALARYAELTLRLGDLEGALGPFARLERVDPANPAWPRARGRVFMEIDRYELAAEAFRSALRLDPSDPDLRFEMAEADFLRGDLDAGLANLDRCVAARPDDARVITARAECLHALGRRDEAQKDLDRLLAREPRFARALRLRAGWHLERREPLEAATLLERALEVDPDDWRARYQLALAYEKLGRREDARAQSERAKADQGQARGRH